MNNKDDVIEIDLQELFGIVLNRLWLILACGLVTGIAGFCISFFLLTPQYESTTKVYILNKQDNSTITYSDMQLGTQLTKDYAELIKSRDVLETVIENCGLMESYKNFAGRVTVTNITDTRIIAITVRDEDPAMAQLIADEIRKEAADHIKNVTDVQAVNVAEEANLPLEPADPSIPKWTVIGMMLGLLLSGAWVVAKFLLDDTVKTSEDVEKYLGLSTLAMIPIMEDEVPQKGKKKRKYYDAEVEKDAAAAVDKDADSSMEVKDLDVHSMKEGK